MVGASLDGCRHRQHGGFGLAAAGDDLDDFGLATVSVPVLSKTITSSFVASSSAAAFLNRMPCMAPRPVPTMTAIGVAGPIASGRLLITRAQRPLAAIEQ